VRGGTAKLLTLFRPAIGEVRAKGVKQTTNAILHPWLKEQIIEILAELDASSYPRGPMRVPICGEGDWEGWFERKLLVQLPPIRMILIWDNLAGHKNYELWKWLVAHGVMPLFTPLSGSWLNMAESVQRIIVRRALDGQHPQSAEEVIEWLEETVRGWNRQPTPFIWGGKRQERRKRARLKVLRRLGGSGAVLANGYSIAA
jgi:transposase